MLLTNKLFRFLVLWGACVMASMNSTLTLATDSVDSGDTSDTTVECSLDEIYVDYLLEDKESGKVYQRPEENIFKANSLAVKECWCARALGRTREYCPAKFNTCQVQGEAGAILCFSKDTKLNVARGVWPFCLFWSITLFYLWVASEPGRRARSFIRRHRINLKSALQQQPEEDIPSQQEQTISIDPESARAQPEDTATTEQSRNNTTTTTTTNNNNNNNVQINDDDDTANPDQDAPRNNVDPGPANSTERVGNRTTFPSEFQSRSNYSQLLQDLYRIHRFEPERMARLWHNAWSREQQMVRRPADDNQSQTVIPAWWSTQRPTVNLALKTKRFEITDEERQEHDGQDDNDNDSFEDGRGSCAICLVEMEHGDIVGDIPCHHVFHKDCLKSWLQRSNRCPLCQQHGIAVPRLPPLMESSSSDRGLEQSS